MKAPGSTLSRVVGSLHASRPFILLSLVALVACQKAEPGGAKKREPATVGVVTVKEQDVPFEVAAFGTVEASSSVDIVSQVTGRVTQVHFAEGDVVKKGDLLFSIDTRPYNASLAVAQAELARSQALAAQAQTEAERASRLEQEGIASAQEATKARAEADSSAATVRLSQAAARSAGLNVAFTKVTSPIEGRTGSLLVHAGNVVHAADTKPMVVIRSLTPVLVRFSVPQELLPTIRARQAQGPLTVRVTAPGDGARAVEGPLTFIENAVDETTGMLGLKATFANANLELWPGAAVDVVLVLSVDKKAVVVPEAAIQSGQDGTYAFVVDDAQKAMLRKVEVLRSTPTLALIRSGLRPGERVVTEGQVRLENGAKVSIRPAASAANARRGDGGA